MSEQQEADAQFDPLRPYREFWSGYQQQAEQALRAAGGAADAQAGRRQWLDSAGKSIEAYLRSPPFLHMFKAQIDTLIAAQHRWRALASRSSGQDSTSLSDLSAQLQALEHAFSVQLQALESRVERIEARLGEREPPR